MSAFKSMPIGTRVTELDVRSFSNIGTSDISARYPTNSLTEQYGTVRQHLLLSLHELDKLYNETVHSLNVFSQHFNSEALVIQHQIQADHHVRRVFCAKTDVTREDLSHVDELFSTRFKRIITYVVYFVRKQMLLVKIFRTLMKVSVQLSHLWEISMNEAMRILFLVIFQEMW